MSLTYCGVSRSSQSSPLAEVSVISAACGLEASVTESVCLSVGRSVGLSVSQCAPFLSQACYYSGVFGHQLGVKHAPCSSVCSYGGWFESSTTDFSYSTGAGSLQQAAPTSNSSNNNNSDNNIAMVANYHPRQTESTLNGLYIPSITGKTVFHFGSLNETARDQTVPFSVLCFSVSGSDVFLVLAV